MTTQDTKDSGSVEDNHLGWDVFVNPSIPMVVSGLPPGQSQMVWQPIASTLIYGDTDAVLVDPPLTIAQTNAVISWVVASGKKLTTIYSTHGHGDHWFGIGALLDRFPGARAVATRNIVELMRQHVSPEATQWWRSSFPGQIPDRLAVAEELDGDTILLEGERLVAVEVGHGDSDHSTCLNVPSIGLVVAGDVAYNDVHQYFVESDHQKRGEWISALDKIESLSPRAVIAGHKRPGREDSPRILEETRQYIRDFDRVDGMTTTALELYGQMLKLYPDRVNPGMLWTSALGAKGGVPSQ
ncbi:MAG: MBL fold metallo-hydrolase [Thaumarchaeota archaeon]|nr:MBL fold metallo-hydrolase [Nitrososphaerota archaeon]